jgi:hypothetical protein
MVNNDLLKLTWVNKWNVENGQDTHHSNQDLDQLADLDMTIDAETGRPVIEVKLLRIYPFRFERSYCDEEGPIP